MVGDGPFFFLEPLDEFVRAALSGQSLWASASELYGPYPHKWPARLTSRTSPAYKNDLVNTVNALVLAVWAPQVDSRMLAQHAAFTVHAADNDLSKVPDHDRFLIRFQIKRNQRPNILRDLRKAGTRESTIYPDLGHLAADLEEEWREIVAVVNRPKAKRDRKRKHRRAKGGTQPKK
jgi:hypothetical protein